MRVKKTNVLILKRDCPQQDEAPHCNSPNHYIYKFGVIRLINKYTEISMFHIVNIRID